MYKTGHYPVVKTKCQTLIPIHKCPYRFRFQMEKREYMYMSQARDAKQYISVTLIGSNPHPAPHKTAGTYAMI